MFNNYIRKVKKSTSLFLILILVMAIVSGCGQSQDTGSDTLKQESQEELSKTRIITDMAGREVEVPTNIEKVFTTSPVATITLYTINPDKMAAINKKVSRAEEKYILEQFQNLPALGNYRDSSSGNEEEILNLNPDIIISMGSVDEKWVSSAEEAQERLGIPFIMVDSQLENFEEIYKFLGDLLGEEERASKLAEYCKNTISDTKELASKISEEDRVSVYYATGEVGLTTNVTGSLHAQVIDVVGAKNAAEIELEKISSEVDVSIEQVLSWNPEVIIATSVTEEGQYGAYEAIAEDSRWSNMDAVKNGQVYSIPDIPFRWFDKPASVNRIIGVRWLGNLIYPEEFEIDIKEETKDFYKLFYHIELTDEDVEEILKNSIVK